MIQPLRGASHRRLRAADRVPQRAIVTYQSPLHLCNEGLTTVQEQVQADGRYQETLLHWQLPTKS